MGELRESKQNTESYCCGPSPCFDTEYLPELGTFSPLNPPENNIFTKAWGSFVPLPSIFRSPTGRGCLLTSFHHCSEPCTDVPSAECSPRVGFSTMGLGWTPLAPGFDMGVPLASCVLDGPTMILGPWVCLDPFWMGLKRQSERKPAMLSWGGMSAHIRQLWCPGHRVKGRSTGVCH